MDYYNHVQTPFSKALLSGVFAGIVATVVCLAYNIIYRDSTGFKPADFINVSSLIFAVNLVFLIVGAIYFLFISSFKKGELIFIAAFVLLTLFLVWKAEGIHRWTNQHLSSEFRGLLLGIIIISGISAAFLVPYLFHNKKFEEHVL